MTDASGVRRVHLKKQNTTNKSRNFFFVKRKHDLNMKVLAFENHKLKNEEKVVL